MTLSNYAPVMSNYATVPSLLDGVNVPRLTHFDLPKLLQLAVSLFNSACI